MTGAARAGLLLLLTAMASGEDPGERAAFPTSTGYSAAVDETHRAMAQAFIGSMSWTIRPDLDGASAPWIRPTRRLMPLHALEDGSARSAGFLPLYPVRSVILETRKQRLRNENQFFGARIVLARGVDQEALIADLEGRYGGSFEIHWAATADEAVRAVKTGQSPFTFLDSDLALQAAAGDADLQVTWKWLENLASVRWVGWKAADAAKEEGPDGRWERPLSVRWATWLSDRHETGPWRILQRAWDLTYANYLVQCGPQAKAADALGQVWRTREGNRRYEERLDRVLGTNAGAPPASWAPLVIEYLGWANPFEVRLTDLDRLYALPAEVQGEWLDLARKKVPQVWDRWASLRGVESHFAGLKSEPSTAFEAALTPEDRRTIQRLFWKKQGETLMRAGKYDEACSLFERVVQEDPEDLLTRRQLAESTQRRESDRRESMLRLNLLAAREAARSSMARGDDAGALEAWRRVLAVLPGDPEARRESAALRQARQERERRDELEHLGSLLDQGISRYQDGHPEKAVLLLESLLDLAPGNTKAQEYLELARGALAMAGDEEEDPRSPYAEVVVNLQSKAKSFEARGLFQEGDEEWRRLLALFPKNREAQAGTLRCREKIEPGSLRRWANGRLEEASRLRKEHRIVEARTAVDQVRRLDPGHPGLKGFAERAETVPSAAPKIDPSDLAKWYDEAMNAYGREDLAGAREIYRSILAKDPAQVPARLYLDRIDTRLLFGMATNAGAAPVDNSGREEFLRRLHQHALDLYNQGRVLDAVKEWERIVKLDPSDKRAHNSIRRAQALRRQQ
ncbi:MAG: tetratricopeptide repeat protein [Spirochaetes bacterium]|nr:tetratricopeptide repeat protein [Spirochaetota bacterium]